MAKDKLKRYHQRRDFEATSEPAGEANGKPTRARRSTKKQQAAPRFVIQEHSARSMHWDLRLEHEGALPSWAIPRGLPPVPGVNNLAVRTEDHPLEYIDFEGTIPKGQYGAGTMTVFDTGTYEVEEWNDEKVQVVLHGERIRGRYGLFRTRDDQWMIHRMDPPQDEGREPFPDHVDPMLAKLGALPEQEEGGRDWAWEVKWDGIRAMVFVQGARVRIESRNRNDITAQYPEFARMGRQLGAREAVLDGEIVALDEKGVPSFQRLQSRMGLKLESTIRRRMREAPATLVLFDVVYLDGHSTMLLPYHERRELLEGLGLKGESWHVPGYHTGDGRALVQATAERGLEGIVAKRMDSLYTPGRRSPNWVKVKNFQRQEFVIGGYTLGEGSRANTIGALLVGYHDRLHKLVYAGSVGTGFNEETLRMLLERLQELERDESPFDVGSPGAEKPIGKWRAMSARNKRLLPQVVRYVAPELVCEVEYTEFTRDGTLRHPSFKGLREDKPAREVVLEMASDEGVPTGNAAVIDQLEHEMEEEIEARSKRKRPARRTEHEITVGRRRLKLSNLAKVLYPKASFTKADVIDYYTRISPVLLPHLKNRMLTLKRYPEGVEGDFFYEKQKPSHAPEWVKSANVQLDSKAIDFVLANDLPTLVWLANIADLELHTSLSKVPNVQRPTTIAFDLDPGPPATIVECSRVALILRDLFGQLGMEAFPKTSGSKGMQIYLPLNNPAASYEKTKPFAAAVARLLEKQNPDLVVSRQLKALRTGKVLIDWTQNEDFKTTVNVYSLRAKDQPTVSTPITWEEVEECCERRDPDFLKFRSHEVLERVAAHGDLFEPVLKLRQRLPHLD